MKRRVALGIGILGILGGIWLVSLERYKDSRKGVEKGLEDQETSNEKPYIHKRFPANGDMKREPQSFKSSNVNPPQYLDRSPSAIRRGYRLSKTRVIKQGSGNFSVVEDLIVVNKERQNEFSRKDIIAEKFNKLLVRAPSDGRSEGLVVHNERTQRLAIITGVFKVKLHDHDHWSQIQNENDLGLEANFPGIRLSLFKSADLSKLEDLLAKLQKDPRVERVELEVLESPQVPK